MFVDCEESMTDTTGLDVQPGVIIGEGGDMAATLTPAGELNKQVLHRYLQFGCERQLFLTLARDDARWLEPARPLAPTPFSTPQNESLKRLGREFEQQVYAQLLAPSSRLPTIAAKDAHHEVVLTRLRTEEWRTLGESFLAQRDHDVQVMLEHEFHIPEGYFQGWLGIDASSTLPVATRQWHQRPDLMLFERAHATPRRVLLAGGEVGVLPATDERVAIRIIDVKHTHSDHVGGPHFLEILYYMSTLVGFLAERGLDDMFCVPLEGHGILPQYDPDTFRVDSPDALDEVVAPLVWDDQRHLLEQVIEHIRGFWERAPLSIEETQTALQPACIRCPFIGDCRATYNYDAKHDAQPDAHVRLLPYTSRSVAAELEPHDIATITDLEARHATLPVGDTPTPLLTVQPMLGVKARALTTGTPQWAGAESHGDQRHMSMAIPKFSQAVISIAAERDPTYERLFALAITADIRCNKPRTIDGVVVEEPYARTHDALWRLVASLRSSSFYKPDVSALVDELFTDPELDAWLVEQSRDDLTLTQLRQQRHAALARLIKLVGELDRRGDLEIVDANEPGERVRVRMQTALMNMGGSSAHEQRFAMQIVKRAVDYFEIVGCYEALLSSRYDITRPGGATKSVMVQPSSAVFYWSADQLEHLRDMLERHLAHLLTDPSVGAEFSKLLRLITPSASSVTRDYMNRKIFDLRRFVETSVGLPQVINYTWHETAHQILPNTPKFSPTYWSQHYNYMFFGHWHDYLQTNDDAIWAEVRKQVKYKARVVGQLARTFQAGARYQGMVSTHSRAISTRSIATAHDNIPSSYHFMARAWTLYDRLTGAIEEQVRADQRLTFPLESIARLEAAAISDLNYTFSADPTDRRLYLSFSLRGLSANVKFKRHSRVLLLHEARRDFKPGKFGSKETIELTEMTWDAHINGFRCEAVSVDAARKDATSHPLQDQLDGLPPGDLYLYSPSMSVWGYKLTRILRERGLGESWLGARRAYLMEMLPPGQTPPHPSSLDFDIAQVCMFAPELLESRTSSAQTPLLTQAHPTLDASQEAAVRMVFDNTISCILGPPGTGKSQTIAAIVDEFIARNPEGPCRILISSASYEPMHVVLKKLAAHQDASGASTHAANIARVWLRSAGKDPLDLDGVTDVRLNQATIYIDDVKTAKRKALARAPHTKTRLDDLLPERMVMCMIPHQIANIYRRDRSGRSVWHDDTPFDLIIVDEASQMPVDQALMFMGLTRSARVTLETPENWPGQDDALDDVTMLQGMRVEGIRDEQGRSLVRDDLTRIVFVGDHNQLPPVQPVEPPEKLAPILQSAFAYFQLHVGVPSVQLQRNYRSRPEIVTYTNDLHLYEQRIEAFHASHDVLRALPAAPVSAEAWIQRMLRDESVINAVVHSSQFDTSVSLLEVQIITPIVEAFYVQMAPTTPAEERAFWSKHLGIVSPHNAQGQHLIRALYQRMGLRQGPVHSLLGSDELMSMLSDTIYSVEKFQGSDRTFIIASMGISAPDQIRAEESFVYDVNRLNVLTSRAVQKMLLVTSQNLLDYAPRERAMVGPAARYRDFALRYCNSEEEVEVAGETCRFRWHDPANAARDRVLEPMVRSEESAALDPMLEKMLEGMSEAQRALLLKRLQGS